MEEKGNRSDGAEELRGFFVIIQFFNICGCLLYLDGMLRGSFISILFIVIKTLLFGDPVSGWPSTVCIIFFMGGIQLFTTGIIGEYLAKTYLETKNRPVYIVKETEKDV